MGKGNQLS